jgi:hypothetical protein
MKYLWFFALWTHYVARLAGIRLAAVTDVKQSVTSWLHALETKFFYAGKRVLVQTWDNSLNVNGENLESDVYHLLPRAMHTTKLQ